MVCQALGLHISTTLVNTSVFLHRSILTDSLQEPQQDGSPSEWESLTVEEAFYLATLGGAECLGIADKIGNFMVTSDASTVRTPPLLNVWSYFADWKKF